MHALLRAAEHGREAIQEDRVDAEFLRSDSALAPDMLGADARRRGVYASAARVVYAENWAV